MANEANKNVLQAYRFKRFFHSRELLSLVVKCEIIIIIQQDFIKHLNVWSSRP